VKHVYYTSLAFGGDSKAGVMRAHLRTEEFLKGEEKKGLKVTILREGLYNESWPLYLGYYSPKDDEREEIILCGEGKISWTAIKDLGLANALVLAATSGEYEGKTLYLSAPKGNALSLKEVAECVGRVRGRQVKTKVVGREEYVRWYVENRGLERDSVEWWSTSYEAVERGECEIGDGTLGRLLESKGVEVTRMEDTIREMVKQ
jgi:nucleoside-diphosphate-sugar epimerase